MRNYYQSNWRFLEYALVLLVGTIGGLPLAGVIGRAGYPLVGSVVMVIPFCFAVWAVVSVEMD